MGKIWSLILVVPFLAGCLSHTTLRTSDPDATLRIGDRHSLSPGKLDYQDRQPFWGSSEVVVEKAGCQPRTYRISKTDEFSPEGFLTGFITYGVGFFWMGTYLPTYKLDYKCEAGAAL